MPIFVGDADPVELIAAQPEVFRLTWTSPAGRVTSLYSLGQEPEGFVTLPGISGLDMPEFSAYTDTSPGFDGEINRGFRTEPRDISVPVLMYASDGTAYRAMRKALFTDMNPRPGVAGILTVTDWDGERSREIECFYAGGLQGALDGESQGMRWMAVALEFRAPDPYWLGAVVSPMPLRVPDEAGWLPLYPIRATASAVLGSTTVTNTGEADAFASFTITGPATSVTLTNHTSGEVITLAYTLEADDTVVINTQAGRKSVILNGVTNLYPYLTTGSTLWALKPGVNNVTFSLPGQAPETTLAFTYRERFLAAW